MTEVTHMLDFNVKVQVHFLEWVMKKGVIIYTVRQHNISRIVELIIKYSELAMDFADATLDNAAEEMGIKKIISIDSDFDIYRLPGKEWIANIFSL